MSYGLGWARKRLAAAVNMLRKGWINEENAGGRTGVNSVVTRVATSQRKRAISTWLNPRRATTVFIGQNHPLPTDQGAAGVRRKRNIDGLSLSKALSNVAALSSGLFQVIGVSCLIFST